MTQIKKFGVMQTAKVAAIFYLVASAIIFIPVTLITVAAGKAKPEAVLFFVLAPLLYCAIGFIFVSLTCLVYNFLAARIGGIEIEFDKESSSAS